ncbi:MAG: hypothetical protein LCH52_10990 [Bacteroidetes bacterium]|nr:hypothetical protein [Bacteroidota bacterium]
MYRFFDFLYMSQTTPLKGWRMIRAIVCRFYPHAAARALVKVVAKFYPHIATRALDNL